MLKKASIRRIMTSTIALIIVTILYFFPDNTKLQNINQTISYENISKTPIYLLNKDHYLAMTTIAIQNNDPVETAKSLIKALTIGENNDNIPKNFSQVIPKNTRILNISLENGLLKINFSKEFLEVAIENEEKIIEALIYTLTDIKGINEIMIFVDNTKLDYLPLSHKYLPNTLDRNYGINKIYDISSIKDVTKTTIYYLGKEENLTYYIPITKIDNNNTNKIEIIIEELKSAPIYETNLYSYLASSVLLLNYETIENSINLTFNNEIFNDFTTKNILEEVKYCIALSIKDTLQIDIINFLVDGKIYTTYINE